MLNEDVRLAGLRDITFAVACVREREEEFVRFRCAMFERINVNNEAVSAQACVEYSEAGIWNSGKLADSSCT